MGYETHKSQGHKWTTVVHYTTGKRSHTIELYSSNKEKAVLTALYKTIQRRKLGQNCKITKVEAWVHGLDLPPNERHSKIFINKPVREVKIKLKNSPQDLLKNN